MWAHRAAACWLMLAAGQVQVASAAVTIVPGEAHGKTATLSCGIGSISIQTASYGGNLRPGPTCAATPPSCKCECGGAHANPPEAVVTVTSKVATVCDGLKLCEFAVCWQVAPAQAGICHKDGSVALGDPCSGCFKDFEVHYACSWGGEFMLIFLVSVGVYAGGGYAMNHKVKGLSGVDALPNLEFWREVAGLAQDGVRFAQARAHGREHTGYRKVQGVGGGGAKDESSNAGGGGREMSSKNGSSSKRTKGATGEREDSGGGGKGKRSSEESRKEKKSRSRSKGKSSSGDVDPEAAVAGAPEPVSAEAAQPGGPKSAASGGGGRWVHMPS